MTRLSGSATVSFDERDQELIAFLSNHFDRSGNLEIDVMTLPHHGEWGSEDLERVSVSCSVILSGAKNLEARLTH